MTDSVKRAPIDLANAERPVGDRPDPEPSTPVLDAFEEKHGRYWLGPASHERNYWRSLYEEERRKRLIAEEALQRFISAQAGR